MTTVVWTIDLSQPPGAYPQKRHAWPAQFSAREGARSRGGRCGECGRGRGPNGLEDKTTAIVNSLGLNLDACKGKEVSGVFGDIGRGPGALTNVRSCDASERGAIRGPMI